MNAMNGQSIMNTQLNINNLNGQTHGQTQTHMTILARPFSPSVAISCPILRRLCDDTYVPTQLWPKDQINDKPYLEATILQLQQFGGITSISKLRGFLRTRINAPDNIKSVPLKAMLTAYPNYFQVRNNQVNLMNFQ